jgi:membrane associated rhomboid family serine protease
MKYWPWLRWKRDADGVVRDRRWLWTPITYRFQHGGWLFLSLPWLWRFGRPKYR